MSKSSSDKTFLGLTTKRIEALADGIFAIAMTLLVLNLMNITDGAGADKRLSDLLADDASAIFHYALAFVLLAALWISHHRQFHHIQRSDVRLIWINVFMLMFVALMPFSTSLLGDFKDDSLAGVFFAGNYLVITLLYLASWTYATHNYRLIDRDTDTEIISSESRRYMVVAVVSVIAIILSLFIPDWGMSAYFLIPILLRISSRWHKRSVVRNQG